MAEEFDPSVSPTTLDRRAAIKFAAAFAGGAAASGLAVPAQAQEPGKISEATLAEAENLLGLEFTEAERKQIVAAAGRNLKNFEALRKLPLENSVPPAFGFNPEAPLGRGGSAAPAAQNPPYIYMPWEGERPASPEEISFLGVARLGSLLRSGKLSPVELAEICIDRLKRIGPKLHCVVTLTEELALRQAREAEAELKAGRNRGPLHGIPWGAKDMFAVPGYPTTWGAAPYRDRVIDAEAAVVRKLREAGAVLAAKLSLGELAMGDLWYEERTRNPWNTERGSSGSSAGPAAATAAGLLPFAIGSETLGSIVSPSHACGVTGLRPTFGRVSRAGAMALSWTMDKVGPLARSAEDCALAFSAIHGADPADHDAVTRPFAWPAPADFKSLRIGYAKADFDRIEIPEAAGLQAAVREKFESLGARLTPIELPDYPTQAMHIILSAEAAAAFDEFTRANLDDQLKGQHPFSWPNNFRSSRFIPAVEYIQAQRARTLLMRAMDAAMQDFDLYLTPSTSGASLAITNLTGHPSITIPIGLRAGMPESVTLIGRLYDEARIVAVAEKFQSVTEFHRARPPLAG